MTDSWFPAAFRASPFEGFRDLLDVFAGYDRWPHLDEYERLWLTEKHVVTAKGVPLRLVEQATKSRRTKQKMRNALYDVCVVDGALPTRRENWHDFFNVMMFAAFPLTKQLLHARQRQILEARLPLELTRLPGARTEEQDCLTILDEGGVILATNVGVDATLDTCLDVGDHAALSASIGRGLVSPWLLGHAHLEHLVRRQTPLPRAKPVVLSIGADASRARVDSALAQRLGDPEFCASRNRRPAIALEALYVDLG